MGLTQGLLATLVADTAPADLRGTAFGVFNLASGAALLVASVAAGSLWDAFGPKATFLAGAGSAPWLFWGFWRSQTALQGGWYNRPSAAAFPMLTRLHISSGSVAEQAACSGT